MRCVASRRCRRTSIRSGCRTRGRCRSRGCGGAHAVVVGDEQARDLRLAGAGVGDPLAIAAWILRRRARAAAASARGAPPTSDLRRRRPALRLDRRDRAVPDWHRSRARPRIAAGARPGRGTGGGGALRGDGVLHLAADVRPQRDGRPRHARRSARFRRIRARIRRCSGSSRAGWTRSFGRVQRQPSQNFRSTA